MKTRCIFTSILAGIFVLMGIAIYALRPREPVYQGKPLGQWLKELNRQGETGRNREAILQIGTNALPFLVSGLCSEDAPVKLKLMQWYNQRSPIKLRFSPAVDRRGAILRAF